MTIGIATITWLIMSGGVIMAAKIKTRTNAYFRSYRHFSSAERVNPLATETKGDQLHHQWWLLTQRPQDKSVGGQHSTEENTSQDTRTRLFEILFHTLTININTSILLSLSGLSVAKCSLTIPGGNNLIETVIWVQSHKAWNSGKEKQLTGFNGSEDMTKEPRTLRIGGHLHGPREINQGVGWTPR